MRTWGRRALSDAAQMIRATESEPAGMKWQRLAPAGTRQQMVATALAGLLLGLGGVTAGTTMVKASEQGGLFDFLETLFREPAPAPAASPAARRRGALRVPSRRPAGERRAAPAPDSAPRRRGDGDPADPSPADPGSGRGRADGGGARRPGPHRVGRPHRLRAILRRLRLPPRTPRRPIRPAGPRGRLRGGLPEHADAALHPRSRRDRTRPRRRPRRTALPQPRGGQPLSHEARGALQLSARPGRGAPRCRSSRT